MKRQYWTDEQDAELRRMIADGCGYAEMGAALGRSRNALRVRAHKFGLKLDVAAWQARAKAALKPMRDEAEYRRKLSEGQRRAWTPERREAARQSAIARRFWEPGLDKLATCPAARKARVDGLIARVEARLQWCPKHLRADYHLMVRKVGMAAAREMTLDTIAREQRAAKRAEDAKPQLPRFERQLAAVQAGRVTIYEIPRTAPLQEGPRG